MKPLPGLDQKKLWNYKYDAQTIYMTTVNCIGSRALPNEREAAPHPIRSCLAIPSYPTIRITVYHSL